MTWHSRPMQRSDEPRRDETRRDVWLHSSRDDQRSVDTPAQFELNLRAHRSAASACLWPPPAALPPAASAHLISYSISLRYTGGVDDQARYDGVGKLIAVNGDVYSGEFKAGTFHGQRRRCRQDNPRRGGASAAAASLGNRERRHADANAAMCNRSHPQPHSQPH